MLFLELRPPDLVELVEFLREETRLQPAARVPSEAVLHQLARALQGLTLDEARYALRRALAASPTPGTRVAAGRARREAAAGEPQRRASSSLPTAPSSARSAAWKASRNGCWSAASSFRCATA